MSTDVDLDSYRNEALESLHGVREPADLATWHTAHLGHSGKTKQLRKQIRDVPPEQRRDFGKAVNDVVTELEAAYAKIEQNIARRALEAQIAAESVDVTLPGRRPRPGRPHPSQMVLMRIYEIFRVLGFEVYESPHIELDEYNFTLLNMPPDHPARDMQDTFYISDSVVLRTHTSAGQIRAMREAAPNPIRVLLPGLCYRNEAVTPRSEMQFHQVEGLAVGPDIRMSDLKGVLMYFAKKMFGEDQAIRFRGSYFPFTEPSVEVDIHCTLCHGRGCRVCKGTGWLELLGAGLVHPRVLENGGYDPDKVRGIAFGMGVERMVLLSYGITDIRTFFGNDERILKQFRYRG
jgi:phenylalanyl-tRNA synthetase alpha chain